MVLISLGLGLGLAFFGLGLGLGLALCGLVNITATHTGTVGLDVHFGLFFFVIFFSNAITIDFLENARL